MIEADWNGVRQVSLKAAAITAVLCSLSGCAVREELRLATWNVEYLVAPRTYAQLRDSCVESAGKVPGFERRIPCAIVPRLDRGPADFAALARYARQLDADVLALQEVDGPAAAALFLQGYDYCFTAQTHVQNNGLAIRRGIPFRCEPDFVELSLDERFRRGVVATLFPGTARELRVLGLRLKSGCPEGPLTDTSNPDCESISQQIPKLEAWIEAQARAGQRFAILGDFNRRISLEPPQARDAAGRTVNLWPELDDGDPPESRLTAVTLGAPFFKCVDGDEFDSYIDLVVLGPEPASWIVPGSFRRVTYQKDDAHRYGLSDHCPVGIDLHLPARPRSIQTR
jgi:exonuclease III